MTAMFQPTRRTVLALSGALAVNAVAYKGAAGHETTRVARGLIHRPDGVGIQGVLVTNGIDVVRTDSDGRYEIGVYGDCIISVVKPRGYAPPVDAVTRLPRFHYVHQPLGSPAELELAHPGLAPTGPLPGAIDFMLTPTNESDTYEAILFADPQPETHAEVDFIRDGVVPGLIGSKAAFGVTLGDVVGDNLALYDRLNAIIGQIGVPWYNVPGNHDLNFEAPTDRHARETWKRVFGPTHYAFQYGRALFIMLNNVVYGGAAAGGPLNESPYGDRISAAQLSFVANLLAHVPQDTLIVLGMHIPLRSRRAVDGREMAVDDCAELLAILGNRPAVSFSGHTHMSEHRYIHTAGRSEPHHHQVLATVCGSWWSGPFDRRGIAIADACDGTPSGYYVLSVDGVRCEASFRSNNDTREHQVRGVLCSPTDTSGPVHAARLRGLTLSTTEAQQTEIVANVFDGGPTTKVSFSVDGERYIEMAHDRRPDPFVAAVYQQNSHTIKPWVHAENSAHVWHATLPVDLTVGIHKLKIVAVDEFGRSHSENIVFEVMAPVDLVALRG